MTDKETIQDDEMPQIKFKNYNLCKFVLKRNFIIGSFSSLLTVNFSTEVWYAEMFAGDSSANVFAYYPYIQMLHSYDDIYISLGIDK